MLSNYNIDLWERGVSSVPALMAKIVDETSASQTSNFVDFFEHNLPQVDTSQMTKLTELISH